MREHVEECLSCPVQKLWKKMWNRPEVMHRRIQITSAWHFLPHNMREYCAEEATIFVEMILFFF